MADRLSGAGGASAMFAMIDHLAIIIAEA